MIGKETPPNRTIIRFAIKMGKNGSGLLKDAVLKKAMKSDKWPVGKTVINSIVRGKELVVVLE